MHDVLATRMLKISDIIKRIPMDAPFEIWIVAKNFLWRDPLIKISNNLHVNLFSVDCTSSFCNANPLQATFFWVRVAITDIAHNSPSDELVEEPKQRDTW